MPVRIDRRTCAECGRLCGKGSRHVGASARALRFDIENHESYKDKTYDYDNDHFCGACMRKIRPSRKNLERVKRKRLADEDLEDGLGAAQDISDDGVEHELSGLGGQVDGNDELVASKVNADGQRQMDEGSQGQNADKSKDVMVNGNTSVGDNRLPDTATVEKQNSSDGRDTANDCSRDNGDDSQMEFELEEGSVDLQIPTENCEAVYSSTEDSERFSQYLCRQCEQKQRLGKNKPTDKHSITGLKSIPRTENTCCVCKGDGPKSRSTIPELVREQFFYDTGIWIPSKNRCCPHHHDSEMFTEDAMKLLTSGKLNSSVELSNEELKGWMIRVSERVRAKSGSRIDLEDKSVIDADYLLLFGIDRKSFKEIFNTIKDHLRPSIYRTPMNALGIFLAKLRLGISQKLLGFLFGVPQEVISTTIARVALLLETYFVPTYLGFDHKSRNDFLAHNDSEFARKLHEVPDGCLLLILDGTYLYTQKSGDHKIQKKSFSMQKGRNVLKVMVVVTATGYIVDVVGIYFADGHHNDAKILEDMINEKNGATISALLKSGDFMILDRGFRDVIEHLTEMGINAKMPHLLGKKQTAFTEVQANESRLVTLVRWVVEAVNGRLKNMFHFFDMVIPHQYYGVGCDNRLRRYLRIACAIMNKVCSPIFHDTPDHEKLLELISQHKNDPNTLREEIEENKRDFVTRRTCWHNVSSKELEEFPRLSLSELRTICMGKFNLKNAPGYVDDHLKADEKYHVQLHKERPGLLRVRLQSKYRGSTSHLMWIEFGSSDNEPKIKRYFCQCRGGARTLGTCSHVTSVLWFLGYKRHICPNYQPKTYGEDILDIVARRVSAEVQAESEPGTVSDSSDSEED